MTREGKAILGGLAVFVGLVVLTEILLRVTAAVVAASIASGSSLATWERVLVAMSTFVARYFIFLLPILLLLCIVVAVALARGRTRNAAN